MYHFGDEYERILSWDSMFLQAQMLPSEQQQETGRPGKLIFHQAS